MVVELAVVGTWGGGEEMSNNFMWFVGGLVISGSSIMIILGKIPHFPILWFVLGFLFHSFLMEFCERHAHWMYKKEARG